MKNKFIRWYYKILIKGIRYFYAFIICGILLFLFLGFHIEIDGEKLIWILI